MDSGSQQTVALINSVNRAAERLDRFGYGLFLKLNAPSRANALAGVGEAGMFVCTSIIRDNARQKALNFAVRFKWTETEWVVQANVEEEDDTQAKYFGRDIWRSKERRANSIDELLEAFDDALAMLEDSVADPAVAKLLATVEPRDNGLG
jgi:hypothetical protein